jgi:5-methylcytosine-specific restriction endonuclease McrA
MQPKLKMCAGHDGVEHQAYIYKNIDGKKYCKFCTQKLEPPKQTFKLHAIKKISDKQKDKLELKKELIEQDKEFYLDCWRARFMFFGALYGEWQYHTEPKCEVCRKHLGYEPNLTYFHHILEKRNFPELRHLQKNIAIICSECHNRYETMPDQVPYLQQKRDEILVSLL